MRFPFAPITQPGGAPLPLPYRWLLAHGLTGLTPWHWIEVQATAEGLRAEFLKERGGPTEPPADDWMPFAWRQDCDDVAGFCVRGGQVEDRVVVVHLTWSGRQQPAGWPGESPPLDFWGWFTTVAAADSAGWAAEEALADLLSD